MNRRTLPPLIVALLLAVGVFTVAPGVAPAAQATGLVKCDQNADGTEDNDGDVAIHSEAWDPIVFHNVGPDDPAQPHLHDFFGNRLPTVADNFNTATYADMTGQPTSCRLVADTASYWAPAMVCTKVSAVCAFVGQRIGVRQFSAYYRGFGGQTKHPGSVAIPAGARLVAYQSGTAGGGPGYGLTGWTCGSNGTVTGGQDTIPDCSASGGGPGDSATAHVNFPSCWTGTPPSHPGDPGNTAPNDQYGDTRDNNYGVTGAHTSNDFIYPTNKTACPASHPIEVVQLRETIAYDYTGDGTDVVLTSDGSAAPGSTMHVDFWNTWDQAAFDSFVQRCIQTSEEANCKP